MVDCYDRLTLRVTEWVVQPLQQLWDQADLSAVTVRPPGRGPRVLVTVTKVQPDGTASGPRYAWSASEVDEADTDRPLGAVWTDSVTYGDPEAAYWAAAEAVAVARERYSSS